MDAMSDRVFGFVIVAMFVVVIALMASAVISGTKRRARCTDNGGRWESVNCRDVEEQMCVVVDHANMLTSCVPLTVKQCDTVCVGARPEAPESR